MEEMCLALMPSARVGVCKLGAWGSAFVGDGGGYVLLGRQCVCVGGGSAFVGGICSWADNVWGWCLHGGEVGAGYWRARAYWEAPAGPVA